MTQTAQKSHPEFLRLLVVDGNSAYLELTKKMLRFNSGGYAVDVAAQGAECLQKAATNHYDLILLTNDLPDTQAMELMETLQSRGIEHPVVVMLEEGQEDLALRALSAGALDYVIKNRGYLTALPFTIRKAIERARLVQRAGGSTKSLDDRAIRARRTTFSMDRHGRFASASPEAAALIAYTEAELLELTLTDLMSREHEWDFFKWLRVVDEGGRVPGFTTMLNGKYGQSRQVQLFLTAERDARQQITGYRGEFREDAPATGEPALNGRINQVELVDELLSAMAATREAPLNELLSRLVDIARARFHFQRASLALLDRQRGAFINQTMVGFHAEQVRQKQTIEVPQEVISRIFGDQFKIKVVYYAPGQRELDNGTASVIPDQRTQKRRPVSAWHQRDLVMVNLCSPDNASFGYISLEQPLPGHTPIRDTFQNLEIFGRLASQFIQNYFHHAALERRTRRLKQMLVTNNIFRLDLALSELLREVVWSVKFSLDFEVVLLGLYSRRSGMLEMRAVAGNDKLKAGQILALKIPQEDCSAILKNEYVISRSYLINKEEAALRPLKHIYQRERSLPRAPEDWPPFALLTVPIRSRYDKIIGFLILDNPADKARPSLETIRLLELLANQISVAMENRVLYLQAKKEGTQSLSPEDLQPGEAPPRGIRRLFRKLFSYR